MSGKWQPSGSEPALTCASYGIGPAAKLRGETARPLNVAEPYLDWLEGTDVSLTLTEPALGIVPAGRIARSAAPPAGSAHLRALCRPRHAAPEVLTLGDLRVQLPVVIAGTEYELPLTASPPPGYPYSVATWEASTLNLVTHVPELLGGALRCTAERCRDLWPCGTACVAAGCLGVDVMGIACEVLAMPTPGELARRAFARQWAAQEARRREILTDWPPAVSPPESAPDPAWFEGTGPAS
jgi:hypothetical protein